MDLVVVRDHPFMQTELVKGAIPTPALADAGRGEAYFVPAESDWAKTHGMPGVWYLRDEPRYVSPDGTYKHVRVVQRGD